ncbi:MAG: hypothetical protein KJ064_01770 [Anaerolineae bacterium]|nr:hypothetical protein [Anaerolineae bacterium]
MDSLYEVSSDMPSPPRRQLPFTWQEALTLVLLVVILLAGYWLRSVGRNWDDYTHLHPDERFLTDVASKVHRSTVYFGQEAAAQTQTALCASRYPQPAPEELDGLSEQEQAEKMRKVGKGVYFDAECSNLNPNNLGFGLYVYGQFPLFTTRVTGEIITEIERDQCIAEADSEEAENDCETTARLSAWESYNGIHFAGRMVSSAADTLTILLVFLVAFRLFGRWPALLAAALYAFAAFPIQQSHFWTVDTFTTLWVMLAIYMAVNVLDNDASKPAVFSPLPWMVAALGLWVWDLPHLNHPTIVPILIYGVVFAVLNITTIWSQQEGDWRWLMGGAAAAALCAIFALVSEFATPMALVGMLFASVVLMALTLFGMNRLAAYGGTLPWMAAAFSVWIFDSLANYVRPDLTHLVIYAVIFTASSILASAVYRARSQAVLWILLLGLPLLVWAVLDVIFGAVSWQGMVIALSFAVLMIGATAFGYRDYIGFGIAFGAALASRVNVAPIVGVLLLAVLIRSLPMLDRRTPALERYRLGTAAMIGLMAAAVLTVLVFRFLQPHAFKGPSIIGLVPNPGWLDDIGEAQRLTSGEWDAPPNHQWANRTPWVFPWQNIVLYGMGPLLGLSGWGGLAWALWKIIRGRPGWTRLAILAAWIVVYFGWLGRNWVTTMRYFLPLYGPLAIFAGWALVELVKRSLEARRMEENLRRTWSLPRISLVLSSVLLAAVLGYTMLYGYGMTAIYRHLLTRVGASIWFQNNVPGDLGLWIELEDGSYQLQNISTPGTSSPPNVALLDTGRVFSYPLTLTADTEIQSVVFHRVADPAGDAGTEAIQIQIQRLNDPLPPEVIVDQTLERDFSTAASPFGGEYSVAFDDLVLPYLPEGSVSPAQYSLVFRVADGPITLSNNVIDNILPTNANHLTVYAVNTSSGTLDLKGFKVDEAKDETLYTVYFPGQSTQSNFVANASGTIRQLEIPHVADPTGDADDETLRVEIRGMGGEISYGQVTGNFVREDNGFHYYGQPVTIALDPPLRVKQGENYTIYVSADAPLFTLGTAVATEGPWDDPLPYNVCALPPDEALSRDTKSGYTRVTCGSVPLFGPYYEGLELYLAAEDNEQKRDTMLKALDRAEYLTISSNRFYDSLARIPYRWPMTESYYDALFDGSLGFELVLEWTSYPRVGPFVWKDQVLPTDALPAWLNEFESEEAFTVYDHPAVFVFRKTENYDPARTREVLGVSIRQYKEAAGLLTFDAEPVNRNVVGALEASTAPTELMLTEETLQKQQENSWSDLFDRDSLLNKNQPLAVIVWWLVMVGMGWLTFPLLFAMFPWLPDRGFSVAKLAGWVLVAWLAWVGGTLRLGLWSQAGIFFCVGVLALVSGGFWWTRRRAFGEYVRSHRATLVAIEGLSLLLFGVFLLVRLRNPDLWHHSFGGEKPMDFAYFNAVLRSKVFPALDPWFSGGYINYYYWGFVLVATPTKLLGIVPALAYNLLIPTLFSFTGMGAFAVAYNVVQSRHDAPKDDNLRLAPSASPWLAGIAALILTVVVGNLDTPRVFADAVAKLGGWQGAESYDLVADRREELLREFREDNGRDPSGAELDEIIRESENPSGIIEIQHSLTQYRDMVNGFIDGLEKALDGTALPIHPHRWYWAPTRVIAELPDGKGHNAIAEMPYFTFLYGDLHAHMVSMPLMLLALLWLTGEIIGAGRGRRGYAAAGMSLFFGGLVVGLLRATNTWDWPTFMILSAAGLTFVAWITQTRRRDEEGADRPHIYHNLRSNLDLRRALRLWPLLWALPAGLMAHSIIWLFRDRRYGVRLDAGEIPAPCLNIPKDIDRTLIPEICSGNLKPEWTLAGSLTWAIGAFALVVFLYVAALVFFGDRFDRRAVLNWLGRLGLFVLVSFVAVLPFTEWYAGEAGLEPWDSDRTPLWAYLDIHGLFLFILASFLIWQAVRWLKTLRVSDVRGLGLPVLLVLVGLPVTLVAALLIGLLAVPVMLVTLPLMALAMIMFFIPGTSHTERGVYALIVLALGLTTGVELVRIDVDIGRQNMVFKFYIQAWLLFAVTGGISAAWLFDALPRWNFIWRGVWQSVLVLLVTIAFMYPIMATQGRWQDRFDASRQPITLDGQDYMKYAVYGENGVWYNFIGDYHMIRWIEENIEGTPTIIEGQAGEYHWGSRIAINTGLPTVIGWNFHQRQQRSVLGLNSVVWNRSNNVRAFYETPDIATAWNLIEFYDIEYIIVGNLERILYNDVVQDPIAGITADLSLGIAKFDRMVEQGLLEVVYEQPSCIDRQPLTAAQCSPHNIVMDRIYRVVPGADYETGQQGG